MTAPEVPAGRPRDLTGAIIRLDGTTDLGLSPDGARILKRPRGSKEWVPFVDPAPRLDAWGRVDGELWLVITVPSALFGDESHVTSWAEVRDGTAWEQFAAVRGAATRAGREALAAVVEHYKAAMQPSAVPVQTGWHLLDGRWVFVTHGSAIGAAGAVAGVLHRIPDVLSGYSLPAPPDDLDDRRRVIRAAILDPYTLAAGRAPEVRRHVTAQAGMAWLAPNGDLFPGGRPDMAASFHGKRESGKSTLARLFTCYFGTFTKASLPANFKDSGPALREKLFAAKDVLLSVEDYRRTGIPADDGRTDATLDTLISAVARSGPGDRAHRTGKVRAARPAATIPQITAEVPVPPELGPERVLHVPVRARLVDGPDGSRTEDPAALGDAGPVQAEADRGTYRLAMADYLRHLAELRDRDLAALRDQVDRVYATELAALGATGRLVARSRAGEQVAYLATGWRFVLDYAAEVGAVTTAEADSLIRQVRSDLLDLAVAGTGTDRGADDRWAYRTLWDALHLGRAHLKDRHAKDGIPADTPGRFGWESTGSGSSGPEWRSRGHGIGAVDLDAREVILDPTAALALFATEARAAGRRFALTADELREQWGQRGWMVTDPGPGAPRRRLAPGGERQRHYLVVRLDVGPDGPDRPAEVGPEVGPVCAGCGQPGQVDTRGGVPWHPACWDNRDTLRAAGGPAEVAAVAALAAGGLPAEVVQAAEAEQAAEAVMPEVSTIPAVIPRPWTRPPVRSVAYLDVTTGHGVTDDGREFQAGRAGRRAGRVAVAAILAALPDGAEVLHLLGLPEMIGPVREWFTAPCPGWTPAGHFLARSDTAIGRWTRDLDGRAVAMHRIETWFGVTPSSPAVAREAMATILAAVRVTGRGRGGVRRTDDRLTLFATPAQTGRDLWRQSVGDRIRDLAPLPAEVQTLIRATSGQGRIELLAADDRRDSLPALLEMDMTFGYAGMVGALGSGPARMLTGRQAAELWMADPYARGRVRVRGQVPAGWDHLGLLGVKSEGGPDAGWEYPSRPGESFDTWADATEVQVAIRNGWPVQYVEAVHLTTPGSVGRPLDLWRDRLVRAREWVTARLDAGEVTAEVAALARKGLRNLVLHGIGAFHGSPVPQTRVTVPAEVAGHARDIHALPDGRMEWTEWRAPEGIAAECSHPEWSSAVWGRCRSRLLVGPPSAPAEGALSLPRAEVIATRTDALYLTGDPGWDSASVGRFRVKARAAGPVPTPRTWTDLDRLRAGMTEGSR